MRLAAGGKEGKKEPEKAPTEIFVSFLGKNLRVLDEDGGSVAPEDVPRVRGSALRFTGCGGEVSFDSIKRPMKERFSRAPFIKFTKGDDAGLVGFDKALDEEDVAFVKEKIPTLNGNPVAWGLPRGTSFPYFSCFVRWKTPFQRKKNTRLGLSGPTPRQSVL
jgi:lupus La protein